MSDLVNLFVLVCLATMWNALAGYVGLVSVGQQLYIGAGAYGVLYLAQHGLELFAAVPIAVVGSALLGVPSSLLVFRLSGAYFAIATWVLAQVAALFVARFSSLGGGTGSAVPGLDGFGATNLLHDYYWLSLGVMVGSLLGVYILLRSRMGLVLTAACDNEIGAKSVGLHGSCWPRGPCMCWPPPGAPEPGRCSPSASLLWSPATCSTSSGRRT